MIGTERGYAGELIDVEDAGEMLDTINRTAETGALRALNLKPIARTLRLTVDGSMRTFRLRPRVSIQAACRKLEERHPQRPSAFDCAARLVRAFTGDGDALGGGFIACSVGSRLCNYAASSGVHSSGNNRCCPSRSSKGRRYSSNNASTLLITAARRIQRRSCSRSVEL
jgi:hypothetical protein